MIEEVKSLFYAKKSCLIFIRQLLVDIETILVSVKIIN